ncbi:MAG: hypothetical protein Q8O67_19475 [Deltaproteobacteria bacterium]|nr:hypothetical protein [Deltaproteobacteria bacterium]
MIRGVAVVVALCGSLAGQAHVAGAEGVIPFVTDGVLVGAGTTWGLVTVDVVGAPAQVNFGQTCEEAIGGAPRAFARVGGGGDEERTLVASSAGIASTIDRGCTWSVVDGAAGLSVTALQPSRTTAGTLWATTATFESDNAVLVSVDDGRSFTRAHGVDVGVLLTSLALAADDRLIVGGVDTTTRTPLLLSSGASSAAGLVALPVPAGAQLVRALVVDDEGLWFSTLDGIGRGHLFRAALDGLSAPVEVGSFDGIVTATAGFAGQRFAVAAGGVLHRAPPGEPRVFARTTEGPLTCLVRVDGDDRLWGCGAQPNGAWFKATSDGEAWADVLRFDEVGEHACPSTTPAAAACAYRFALPPGPADPDPVTDEPRPDRPTCACTQGSAADSVVVVVVVVLAIHRRRRPTYVGAGPRRSP